jgi:hypothetical protein
MSPRTTGLWPLVLPVPPGQLSFCRPAISFPVAYTMGSKTRACIMSESVPPSEHLQIRIPLAVTARLSLYSSSFCFISDDNPAGRVSPFKFRCTYDKTHR